MLSPLPPWVGPQKGGCLDSAQGSRHGRTQDLMVFTRRWSPLWAGTLLLLGMVAIPTPPVGADPAGPTAPVAARGKEQKAVGTEPGRAGRAKKAKRTRRKRGKRTSEGVGAPKSSPAKGRSPKKRGKRTSGSAQKSGHRKGRQASDSRVEPGGKAEPAVWLPVWGAIKVAGTTVSTASEARAFLRTSASFSGTPVKIPVTIMRGARRGKTLCMTAGIHGDELNGIEVVRRVFRRGSPEELAGTLIGLPIVNLHGFHRTSRYLPDRRDLNRFFPGHRRGSSASRIAYQVFSLLKRNCDLVVDLHSGSFHRTNMPQVRADLSNDKILEFALAFAPLAIVSSPGGKGTLRRSLTDVGIPTITYEAGQAMRFELEHIEGGVRGVRELIEYAGRQSAPTSPPGETEVFYHSRWVRVDTGGILLTRAGLGDRVKAGDVLGSLHEPFSEKRTDIRASHDGLVIGLALPQPVIPGFAAFHLGIRDKQVPQVAEDADGNRADDLTDENMDE